MTMMTYRGYEAAVEYDEDAEIFHGEVINLRDVITFQGRSVSELKRAFAGSVEDYLAFCREPSLHKAMFSAAKRAGMSLNKWVTSTLERAVSRGGA